LGKLFGELCRAEIVLAPSTNSTTEQEANLVSKSYDTPSSYTLLSASLVFIDTNSIYAYFFFKFRLIKNKEIKER
jgi:hypothetical protein